MNDFSIPTYYDAVAELVGNGNLTGGLTDGPMSGIGFADGINKPTEAEVQAKLVTLIAEYDSLQYQRDRASEYPTIQDLVVALYDTDDKSDIEAKRAEVKAKYPKPE
jgi:hypothetical protein